MGGYEYKAVARLELLDPKFGLLHKLNVFAVVSVMVSCAIGLVLNYCLRDLGAPGGRYIAYILCGFALCLIYPYVHEYAHAFAVAIVKFKLPQVKFGKFAATCGSPDIVFGKSQYVFVASFPFVFYCAVLIPLCVLLPPPFFPLPFMPLMYNVFGSAADWFLINRAVRTPKGSMVVDGGTEVVIYIPTFVEKH